MNIGVLVLVVIKFSRIFDLDQLFIRNLSTTSSKKAIYVISKLLVGVFLVSHTLGIIFYAIDYAYTLRPICINDQSRISTPIQCAGFTRPLPTLPLWPTDGECATSTRCTGV